MNYRNQAPLFRLLPALIFGILSSIFNLKFNLFIGWPAIILCLLIMLFQVVWQKKYFSYSYRWAFGLATHVLIFSFAYLITELKTEIHDAGHFSNMNNVSGYMAYLDDSKLEKSKSYKATIRIVAVKANNHWIKAKGKCLIYIARDSSSKNLGYGDLIYFTNKPLEVQPPLNPSQFNYKRWLSFNQVYHQLFLASSTWNLVAHHQGFSVVELAIKMKEKLLRIFKENNISGDDYAVVSALLLGDTGEIDQDIIRAYAASGALHVLSVSGLHVGIIYLALSAALFFLNRNSKTKIIKAVILIFFLWYYALLTGLSPAVLRSAAMLSFIVFGKALDRYTNMYNTLAASAIALLCFQPHLLMQVGFQLSYLAVLGIVFLYKRIHQLFNPSFWLWKQIWGVTAVSLAAQLTTFPLGLFYFNQFPNYFLISNLLVIPISTVIIYGGIILFIISPIASCAKWIGLILGKIVHVLNWCVITIEHLPYALMQGISITIIETGLLYFSLLQLILYFIKKDTRFIYASFIAIVFILAFQIAESIQIGKQQQLIVFNIPKFSAVNIINGTSGILVADSALIHNRSMMAFTILHYWWDCGLEEDQVAAIETPAKRSIGLKNAMMIDKNFLTIGTKKILIMNDSSLLNRNTISPISIDYLVLSKNIATHVVDLQKKFHFRQLIIDSSNSKHHIQRWKEEAQKLGVTFYAVADSGAFVVHF